MEHRRIHILDHIDRSKHDPESDHSQDVQNLQRTNNQTAKERDTVSSTSPTDIIDIFPPEVWILIVRDATRGSSSTLLTLTMVSTKWMRALTSVPTLWADIDVRGLQEDSLATIEAFRQLSCDTPVYLTVYVPTGYDQTIICMILTGFEARIREVTILYDTQIGATNQGEESVLQLLLTGSQFNSTLAYINLPFRPGSSLPLIITPLPPSLRAIRGWNFTWRILQKEREYLDRLDSIQSNFPIESVLSRRIQLPALRSLHIWGDLTSSIKLKSEDEEGFPLLPNLTSVTYLGVYREVVIRLLLSVAPQLVNLRLQIPYTKIPLLSAGLQAAVKLETLAIEVSDPKGDEGVDKVDTCPVYQHRGRKGHGLRVLKFGVQSFLAHVERRNPVLAQVERRDPFLSYFMSIVSALYAKVEELRIKMLIEHPVTSEAVLSYVVSLPGLRRLHLQGIFEHHPGEKSKYTLTGLEYLELMGMDISHSISTPNILSLAFRWGFHRHLETVGYIDLRKLNVNVPLHGRVELSESSFPSLQELTLNIWGSNDANAYGHFKLTSFTFLRSIVIYSSIYQPHGTVLCFALLNHPSTCPSLSEITLLWGFPDWDILFLMLEKRNFMMDSAVSLIRRITLPFIPSGLCTPLSSLLRGVYAERPSNEELFMGGAQELLLDEQVPGCVDCLLVRMASCKYPVRGAGTDPDPYWVDQHGPARVEFAWTEKAECEDPTIVDWTVQRQSLHSGFLVKLATWGVQHRRAPSCRRSDTGMEITEHGVV